MLALICVLTIVIMLVLIMTKKLQTLLALIIVPIIGCLVAGFTGNIVLEEGVFTVKTMGEFITAGLKSIAPTGVMFIFAILFFGILTDAGSNHQKNSSGSRKRSCQDLHWYSHFSLSRSFGWFRRSNIPDCHSGHAAAL